MCTITICGDICPTKDTQYLFEQNNTKELFTNVLSTLKKADVLIGNLEFALTNKCAKVYKTGPILKGNTNFINVFKSTKFTALGLANNHIKDCGVEGVISTLETCKKNNIATVGAGENEIAAKKPLIIEKNGFKIGLMAFAEHEFNAAYENEAGANLLDIYDDFDAIANFKKEVDYLVVLYHGGVEYYQYPSPLLQKKCRKMIDSGADMVTCQHSHCIGTKENYNKGTIVYGQGNTIFGYRKNSKSWNEGLLLSIDLNFEEGKLSSQTNYIPIKANEKGGISLIARQASLELLNNFYENSKKITNKNFIKESWSTFCDQKKALYLPHLVGLGRVFIHLNRLVKNKLIKIVYSSKRLRITLNLIRCEAHNEVIQTILKNHKKE